MQEGLWRSLMIPANGGNKETTFKWASLLQN